MPSLRRAPRSLARHAAYFVFAWELAADADAEDQPAFGEVIQRGDLLGDRRGMAQRQQIHRCAERQPPAYHRGLRQLQQRIQDRHGEGDVVADPQ